MSDLVTKIIEVHKSLDIAGMPHAFGGALALAWCTERARGTIDIDINVFVPGNAYREVIDALPEGVKVTQRDRSIFKRDGQVRVWWEQTPLDLFLNTTDYHDGIAGRVRWESFGGVAVPFLACVDLAVFKAFFNRTKDWADLEEMRAAGTLDAGQVRAVLILYLGADDERVSRLDRLDSGW